MGIEVCQAFQTIVVGGECSYITYFLKPCGKQSIIEALIETVVRVKPTNKTKKKMFFVFLIINNVLANYVFKFAAKVDTQN